MRKPLLTLASILLGLAALYLIIVAIVGSRVSSQINAYQNMLMARDDVHQARFLYTRGLFGGHLNVELNWRPQPGDELYLAVAGIPNIDSEGIRLAGDFDVQHGPWLGDAGLGLAKIDQQIQAPQQLRDALPQYPGEAPVLELTSILTLGGNLRTDYAVLDYNGRVVVDNESADLQLAGLRGSFETNSQLTQLQFDLALGELGFALNDGAQNSKFQLSDFNFNADLAEDESTAMLGSTDVRFGQVAFDLPQQDVQGEVSDFSASGVVARRGDVVDNSGSLTVRQIVYNGQPLGGMALESALRGINIESYAVFENLSNAGADAAMTELEMQALMDAVQRLAADQLTFSLDRLVFFLPSEEDISANVTLTYNGSPQINWQSYDELIAALSMDASLRLSLDAINRLIANAGLAPEQQEQYQSMLQELSQLPYFTVTDGILSSSLVLRDGEPVMSAADVMALAGQLSPGAGADADAGSAIDRPQLTAADFGEPTFEHVELQADFQPDPYVIELLAGGEHEASVFDFSCSGSINAEQPDVRVIPPFLMGALSRIRPPWPTSFSA